MTKYQLIYFANPDYIKTGTITAESLEEAQERTRVYLHNLVEKRRWYWNLSVIADSGYVDTRSDSDAIGD